MAIPVRTGSDAAFARVRTLFQALQFNDEVVEKRALNKEYPFPPFEDGMVPAEADGADLLIGLFLRGGRVEPAALGSKVGEQAVADLLELGLVEDTGAGLRPTVRVRPMYDMYVVSDLWDNTAGPNPLNLADDVVFPPDIPNTLTYLSYLPLDPCERFLEACGGSGVGALLLARNGAAQSYSFDITERSTAFAAFSAKLNGLDNFTAGCGDTYEPAQGMLFDRIAVHPPYVPVLKHTWIYHAGGNDGEQITRKHVEDLHKVLAPGGRFYCRCLGSDRLDSPFEKRVREWLGERSDEFDVAIHVIRVLEPSTYVMASIMRGRSKSDEIGQWGKLFEGLKLFRFLASVLVIQRRAEVRPVFTIRRGRGPATGPRELSWLLNWETLRMQGRTEDIILRSRLKAGPVTLQTKHGIKDGSWQTAEQRLEVVHPYFCNWDVDPMGAYILPKADGTKTGAEVLQALVDEGSLTQAPDPKVFARSLSELVTCGFLVVEGHEPPVPAKRVEEEI